MKKIINTLAALLGMFGTGHLHADVKMPAIFGDHMVLQQEAALPVWGTADPGEKVTVAIGSNINAMTADHDGEWMVKLSPLPDGTPPVTMTVAGKNTLTFSDVLVGDVWVCAGQSNMSYPMQGASNASVAIRSATDSQIRYFAVKQHVAIKPDTDLPGQWVVCTPGATNGFSAVSYFFASELRHSIKHPIGLIGSYWPGVPAQAFISLSGLQKDPPFANYIALYEKDLAAYPQAKADYPAVMATFEANVKLWEQNVAPSYDAAMNQWREAESKAKANGQSPPPRPTPSAPKPARPLEPGGHPGAPSILYNGMIAPIIPYAIKGAIWYQGESNTKLGVEYRTLLPRLITDWREKWNQGDFPFLYVQLPNYGMPQKKPSEGGWADLREAQLKTLALPNTGMAIAIDLGGAELHPKDKFDVGVRLARVARHVAYNQDLVYSGPLYDSMAIEGSKIRVSFQQIGGGLQLGAPPWTPTGTPATLPTQLTGFAIAGADHNWVWADAHIDGNTVVVASDQVAAPVAVRYGWASNPPCDLYNKEGLPASPFRTDDWVSTPATTSPALTATGNNQ